MQENNGASPNTQNGAQGAQPTPQPAQPTAQPAQPQQPAQPAQPQEAAQPYNPYASVNTSLDPQPAQPAQPTQPVAEPAAQPVAQPAAQPAQPFQPQPAQPAAQPAQPANPYAAQGQANPYAQPQPQQPFAQPQPGVPGGPAPVYPSAPQGKGKATGALVCGILAILFSWMPIVGIVLGIVAIVLATSFIRQGGVIGTAKAGRVLGIIGIVLSVVLFVFSMVVGFAALSFISDNSGTTIDLSSSGGVAGSLSSDDALDAEERAARDVVVAQLDKLKASDPAMVAAVAALAEKGFTEQTELTMAECGIDSAEYAKKMLEGFDYEIFLVYLDSTGVEADVSADIVCRDVFDVLSRFDTALGELSSSGALDALTVDELKARIGEEFTKALNEADMDTSGFLDVDVDKVNGTWVIDSASWDEEMDYFFGLV